MAREQYLRGSRRIAFRLLKHRKLVDINRFIAMYARLQMPARKVAAKRTRESSRSKAADRSALPVAVVNMRTIQGGFLCPRILERLANRAPPGSFRNFVRERHGGSCQNQQQRQTGGKASTIHGRTSLGGTAPRAGRPTMRRHLGSGKRP